jgi:hypothetical protein
MHDRTLFVWRRFVESVVHCPETFRVEAERGFPLEVRAAGSFRISDAHHKIVSDTVGRPTVRQVRDADGIGHSVPPLCVSLADIVVELQGATIFFASVCFAAQHSIIIRNGAANDIDDISQDAARHTIDRQPVQMIQFVQKAMDDVVPNVCIPHGVRQRRYEIGKRDHRKVDLLPRLRVFHHAEAIAA